VVKVVTMDTKELLKILSDKYPPTSCAFLPEFRGGTGYDRAQTADAIAMHLWPSLGLELIGFELKVSRSDWLHEVKNPDKSEAIKQFCDKWYLVVSDLKVIKYADELPGDWGLMYVKKSKINTIIKAPKLESKPIDRLFLASLMRRAN